MGSAVVAGWLLMAAAVQSNELQRISLEKKVHESDVVVIATVRSMHRSLEQDSNIGKYALLEVDRVVHGADVPDTIRLVTYGPIAENDPWCCTVGTRVLVFAARGEGNYYWVTNGAYGQFVLDGRRVINWPANDYDTGADLDDVLAQISRVAGDR